MHLSYSSKLHTAPHGLHSAHGFTTVELMVTVAILGVLAAIALPSVEGLLLRWRVRQVTGDLQSSLQLARSEAIKRGGDVLIQKITTNQHGCTAPSANREWDCGWIMCATSANTCNKAPVLQRYESPGTVHITRTGGAATIKFNRYGLVAGSYIGFNLVPKNHILDHPATLGLCMSAGGRIRTVSSEDVPCNG